MTTTFLSKQPRYANRYVKAYRLGYRLSEDATATTRMLQALQRIGHSHERIHAATGVGNKAYLSKVANGHQRSVYTTTARAIAVYYWANHLNVLDDKHAKKVITYAKKKGWAPPAAWDDITDSNESPKGVRK